MLSRWALFSLLQRDDQNQLAGVLTGWLHPWGYHVIRGGRGVFPRMEGWRKCQYKEVI